MKYDEEHCSKVDFDIDLTNLLPSPEEIRDFMKQPFNQNNMQLFTNLYQSLSEKDKSDYLFNLLENNSILKSDFIRYFESSYEQLRLETVLPFSFNEQLASITEKADEVAETLGELDFEEPDWDRFQGSGHYVPDYEVAQIVAEDEASDIFEEFVFDLKTVLQTGNLTDIISDFTAVFHGITCAEINDPDNNLGDLANEYFIDELKKLVKESHESLAIRVFAEIDYQNALELAFRFDALYYGEEKDYLQFISGILISTVKNKALAQMVWTAKTKFNSRLNLVPEFLNKVTKLIGDKKIWVESMESCFLQDLNSSIDLMEHYYENRIDEFEKTAPRLWGAFSTNVLDYLLDKVAKGTPFHVSLLKKNASQKSDSASLELLKQYILPEETVEFIDSMVANNAKARFYAHEKLFDKLIILINVNCLEYHQTYSMVDFSIVIPYLFDDRPIVAWEMIQKMITIKMASSKRSRDTYAYVASLLIMAKRIDGIDQEIRTLTSNLYNNKPNLPALKDELRKAGII